MKVDFFGDTTYAKYMENYPKFNYSAPNQPENTDLRQEEESPEETKNKKRWTWSFLIIAIVIVITFIVGGLVGVINGRSTARTYNTATQKYLTTLSTKIEKSKTAEDIAINIRAQTQPELPRAFLGGLSSTYRQAQANAVYISQTITSISQDNQQYVNLANLTDKLTTLQTEFNQNIDILLKNSGEVERKNQLINIEQNCFTITDTLNTFRDVPDVAKKSLTAYEESKTKVCNITESIKDAHSRKDNTRIINGLKILVPEYELSKTSLEELQKVAKENVTNKKELLSKLEQLKRKVSNL